MTTPFHDFSHSVVLAQSDADLRQQLVIHFGTSELSAPDKSPLVSNTVDAMTWVIQLARSMYKAEPEKLVGAISNSKTANALAVWSGSGRDWIVFSEGLMELLRDRMDSIAARFSAMFPDLMNAKLMQRLLAQRQLSDDFTSSLSSFLSLQRSYSSLGTRLGITLLGMHLSTPGVPTWRIPRTTPLM